jgi:hypothetical protein
VGSNLNTAAGGWIVVKPSRRRWLLSLPWARTLPQLVVFAAAGIVVTLIVQWSARSAPGLASQDSLQVKDLILRVREELAAAEQDRVDKNLLPTFELKDFDMEINYVVRNSGGTKVEVLGVGTNVDVGTERVQKLRLHWTPAPPVQRSVPPSETKKAPTIEIPARSN